MWVDEFRRRVDMHPGRVAVVAEGQRYSYAELGRRAESRVPRKSARPGGRHVIVQDAPLDTLEEILGAWIHGLVPTVLNPGFPEGTLNHLRALLESASSAELLPDGSRGSAMLPPERREALLLTTSGTTGLPKLAVMSHATMVRTTAALREYFAQPEETNVLVATPMALSSALTPNAFLALGSGWTLHLFRPSTPPSVLHAYVRAAPIHLLNTVPAFLRIFLRYWNGTPFPAMRRVSFGGEVMPWSSVETLQAMFPEARININYGVTEAGNRVANLDTRDPRARAGGVGKPLSHFDVRVMPVEGSSGGELHLKGPTVFLGYLQPDGSYQGLDPDGFLHTGDLVSFDAEGVMTYHGRRDGLVKVGGRFVNVQAVADALRSLPGVVDAACWATPHALAGHTLTAQVIPGAGVALNASAVREALAARLPSWEIPGELSVRDEISETAAGKRLVVQAAGDPKRPVH